MKNALLACTAALALMGTAAQATTYSVDVTATPFRIPGAPGLQTRAVNLSPTGPQNFNGATYSFDLDNIGDSVSMAVYGLVAFDSPINDDDLLPRPSTATFDFGSLGAVTAEGVSYAVGLGLTGYAFATFVPTMIRVSPTEAILISLSDTIFGTDGHGVFTENRAGIGYVNATFTLASIPLPATLPLVLAGLGAMGAVASRRRKSA